MKAALITFLALIASLALAIFEREAAVGGTRFAGSLAARAAFRSHGGPGGFQGGDNPFQSKGYNQFQGDRNPGSGNPAAPAPTAAAPAAPTFCKLDPSVLGSELNGNPAMPADLDGMPPVPCSPKRIVHLADSPRCLHRFKRLHGRRRPSHQQRLFCRRIVLHQVRLCRSQ